MPIGGLQDSRLVSQSTRTAGDRSPHVDYSLAHPKVLSSAAGRGARVAQQIRAVLCQSRFTAPSRLGRCLDIGSSAGVVAQHLAEWADWVYCVDVDRAALAAGRRAGRLADSLRLVLTDGIEIPFADDCFDLVVFRRVYGYCPLSTQEHLFAEIKRVLRPGGLCYFEGHNLLAVLEPDYRIPFLQLAPAGLTTAILRMLGVRRPSFGRYRSYWGLRSMVYRQSFLLDFMTPMVLKAPAKLGFTRLQRWALPTRLVPLWLLRLCEPLQPVHIWVLKKPEQAGFPRPLASHPPSQDQRRGNIGSETPPPYSAGVSHPGRE